MQDILHAWRNDNMNKKFAKTLAMVLVIAMLLSLGSSAFADADTTAADDGNDYPIVLVHGLFGWGGTEIANLNYWGGFPAFSRCSPTQAMRSTPRR